MIAAKSDSEYYFEKLTENRIDDLLILFNVVFNSFPSKEEIYNKHYHCQGKHKFVGHIAYDKRTNSPVAFHCVFPMFAFYKGQRIVVAQTGDIMTHPHHQKKGLFFHLAKKTHQFCMENDIKMIFAFPNTLSYPLFIKHLGFKAANQLLNITLFENKFEICRFSQKSKMISRAHNLYVKFILSFVSKGDPFPNSNAVLSQDYSYIIHDEEYHKWKTSSSNFFIKIKGVSIWISLSQNQIAIGDIKLINEKDLPTVIKRLKALTFLLGFRFLSIGGSDQSYIINLLKGKYLDLPSYNPVFLDLSNSIDHSNFLFLNSDVDVF